jgi:hypothetical protein
VAAMAMAMAIMEIIMETMQIGKKSAVEALLNSLNPSVYHENFSIHFHTHFLLPSISLFIFFGSAKKNFY